MCVFDILNYVNGNYICKLWFVIVKYHFNHKKSYIRCRATVQLVYTRIKTSAGVKFSRVDGTNISNKTVYSLGVI